jgi:citrate lyase subunit beta-like protein
MSLQVKSLVSALRQRRHVLYVPGHEIAKLGKASQLKTLDTAVFDLEDGVPPAHKDLARANIKKYIHTKPSVAPELAIRINSISSRDGMRDLNEVILDPIVGKRMESLIISKCEDVKEVQFIDRWLKLNDFGHAKILALIETPLGLNRCEKILTTSENVDALIFGAEDFRSAAGISHKAGETAILYARSMLVSAARAHNRQVIDMTSLDFRNAEVVVKEAIGSRNLGFTGRQVIHPMQIACVNQAFTPDAEEVKKLTKLVTDFAKNFYVVGKGVIGTGGIMVELPHITDAIRGLLRAGKTPDEIQKLVDDAKASSK